LGFGKWRFSIAGKGGVRSPQMYFLVLNYSATPNQGGMVAKIATKQNQLRYNSEIIYTKK